MIKTYFQFNESVNDAFNNFKKELKREISISMNPVIKLVGDINELLTLRLEDNGIEFYIEESKLRLEDFEIFFDINDDLINIDDLDDLISDGSLLKVFNNIKIATLDLSYVIEPSIKIEEFKILKEEIKKRFGIGISDEIKYNNDISQFKIVSKIKDIP
jgi:hypothetical protein